MTTLRSFTFIGMLFFAYALSGCASVTSGWSQQVTFSSSPDGATVSIGGVPVGRTPLIVSVKRRSEQTIAITKDGYKPVMMPLNAQMNNWFWGNIICCGLVGSTTDGLSGAVYQYSPDQYMVTLQPEGTGHMETKTALDSRQKAKDFIVVAYRNILSDLGKREGEYLSSLFVMLNIPNANNEEAVKKIRALSDVYSVIPDFADHVIDLYLQK